jgi:hypothetical protein
MLTAKEQLEICKTCKKKSFDSSIGLVCSLTKTRRSFVNHCDDYEGDAKEVYKKIQAEKALEEIGEGVQTPAWKIILGVVLALFALIRLIMTLNGR